MSSKVVEIASGLGKEDVTVGVGEDVDIMLLFEADTSEVDITVEVGIAGFVEVECMAELLDPMVADEIV